MIDWWDLFSNAIWIFALAMLLATFSYQRYRIHRGLGSSQIDAWYRFGTLLFVIGQFFVSNSRLEQVVWSILAIALVAEPVVSRLRGTQQPAIDTHQQEEEYRG